MDTDGLENLIPELIVVSQEAYDKLVDILKPKWDTHPTEFDIHDAKQADVDYVADLDANVYPIYWDLVQYYRNLGDWERELLGFNGPASAGPGDFWG